MASGALPPGRPAAADAAIQDDAAAWSAFKAKFLSADGRVIDTGNADVSHTEGQGWGMLFAATFDDREAFDRIDGWTRDVLRRPGDALHSWRYQPAAADHVPDVNNATDGDLFIAYASSLAAARWHLPDMSRQAAAIASDILSLLVQPVHGHTLLLPAVDGFRKSDGMVFNPSYYAFPMIDALARLVPSPVWSRLRQDGIAAIAASCGGEWGLPPDWVMAGNDGRFTPAAGFPPRFGYDAIRVPLYLAWAGIDSPVLSAASAWWRHAAPPPAWVDVTSGAVAEYPAGPGMAAALQVAIGEAVAPVDILPEMDYYTGALCLLSRVALRDITARQNAAGRR